MKKVLSTIVCLAALAAPTAASAYTHAKQDALIRKLNAKMSCLVKFPVWNPDDYAWYGPSSPDGSGYVVDETVSQGFSNITALDFAYGVPADAWMIGIKNTRSCRRKFTTASDPVSARTAAFNNFRLSRIASLR